MSLAEQIEDARHALDVQTIAERATGLKGPAALLAYVDELLGMREEVLHYQREFHRLRDELSALREAAGKVTCFQCKGSRKVFGLPCPDCAALRALLNPPGEKP